MMTDERIAALRAANIRVPPSGLRLNGQWSYPLTEVAKFLSTEPAALHFRRAADWLSDVLADGYNVDIQRCAGAGRLHQPRALWEGSP
jgi:hypothetical protein